MKVILLSNNICSMPTLQFLANQGMLQAIVCTGPGNPANQQFEQSAHFLNTPFKRFAKNQLLTGFKSMLHELKPDVCICFGFGYKIPPELFDIPRYGFYNVHFSLLPRYRGRCPVFWQIKNGGGTGGITIHRLADEYDAGPILTQKETTIFQGESHGIYSGRLSLESVMLIAEAIEKVKNITSDLLIEQDEDKVCYGPALTMNDLKINWGLQSAKEIENLVNASNPDYGGAMTLFRGQVIRMLEVNMAELSSPAESLPGTIVYADMNHGIFVACNNLQFLRINIIHSSEGFLSGFKMAGLGIRAGERLENFVDM